MSKCLVVVCSDWHPTAWFRRLAIRPHATDSVTGRKQIIKFGPAARKFRKEVLNIKKARRFTNKAVAVNPAYHRVRDSAAVKQQQLQQQVTQKQERRRKQQALLQLKIQRAEAERRQQKRRAERQLYLDLYPCHSSANRQGIRRVIPPSEAERQYWAVELFHHPDFNPVGPATHRVFPVVFDSEQNIPINIGVDFSLRTRAGQLIPDRSSDTEDLSHIENKFRYHVIQNADTSVFFEPRIHIDQLHIVG